MTIQEAVKEAHEIAIDKGWHEEPRTFGDLIALIHSELSEALEDYRDGAIVNHIYETKDGKCTGVPIELADVLIRIFDMCGSYGIDLERAVTIKMEYNKTRTYRHGGKII